jgi:hypothetical protein
MKLFLVNVRLRLTEWMLRRINRKLYGDHLVDAVGKWTR